MGFSFFTEFKSFQETMDEILDGLKKAEDEVKSKDFVHTFDIPGIDPDKIKVSCTTRRLNLDSDKFTKNIELGEGYDYAKTEVSYSFGQLTVKIPLKEEKAEAKEIKIAIKK